MFSHEEPRVLYVGRQWELYIKLSRAWR